MCFFIKNGRKIIFVIYVDDCLIAAEDPIMADDLINDLADSFKLKVMSHPKIFLGLQILRHETFLALSQEIYIEKLAAKFGLEDSKPISTPMEPKLLIQRTNLPSEEPDLRALIGGLLFVARNTRPDILSAVNYISRFLCEGTPQILCYAKRILRYLYHTRDYALVFSNDQDGPITCYVDAAFADVKDGNFESTNGHLLFHFGNLISWSTHKQKRTATSTTEAEYIGLNDAVKEVAFIRDLNYKILGINSTAIVYEDNSSAISIAQGTESSSSRFLLTKEFAIWEAVKNADIDIRKIPGTIQIADIMTKALDRVTFERHRQHLVVNKNIK